MFMSSYLLVTSSLDDDSEEPSPSFLAPKDFSDCLPLLDSSSFLRAFESLFCLDPTVKQTQN
jgi:hypothetical protein